MTQSNPRKVLITGITGMVGSHLADFILREKPGVQVHGMVRWRSPLEHIEPILPKITLHAGELRDQGSVLQVLESVKPDWIFHLAAQSYVTSSFTAPADTLAVNAIGTSNLLESVRRACPKARIHTCSSSEVYGQVLKSELPIREANPLRPASPYAVSKVAEDLLAQQYFLSYGLDILRTRMFTHTGPRRGDVFAESAFAKQVAEIESGLSKGPVKVGNLESVRTFADVRDAVRAYWLLLEKCPAGEVYNIGGDTTMTVGEVLETYRSLSSVPFKHEVDPALLRPSDVTLQIPDVSHFKKATGWAPTIPVKQTFEDLLNYQRARAQARKALGKTSH